MPAWKTSSYSLHFISVYSERNPSSHSSHKMDSVQGERCPVLIINLEGFILAARCCAKRSAERVEVAAWGMGEEATCLPRHPAAFSLVISCRFGHELA